MISQASRHGFRFRTVDEIQERRHELEEQQPPSPVSDHKEPSVDEKKVDVEYIDKA